MVLGKSGPAIQEGQQMLNQLSGLPELPFCVSGRHLRMGFPDRTLESPAGQPADSGRLGQLKNGEAMFYQTVLSFTLRIHQTQKGRIAEEGQGHRKI